MRCLVLKLFLLIKACYLWCHHHREWREVVKFEFCAVLSEGWHFRDGEIAKSGSGRVRLSTQSSDDWEPVSVLPVETLLKREGFIVTGSTGEKVFTDKKNFLRARDADQRVSRVAC
ncbi:hypothetical protein V144x_00080 [Gimesia aquarii]|uniref:Uncharacterized protein n=1 Tax=Gimesia aquarii TaxID=2527964 RepID=A0A517VNI9_9PLAN|nr:hypothetical protein V144x_00080 [Gimesia aquarii]